MALLATTCTYDLVLAFSFMMSKLLKLETPQRVGIIRLNRNAEISCNYQAWDLRGIKCKSKCASQSLLTISKNVNSHDVGHTLISESPRILSVVRDVRSRDLVTPLQVFRLL